MTAASSALGDLAPGRTPLGLKVQERHSQMDPPDNLRYGTVVGIEDADPDRRGEPERCLHVVRRGRVKTETLYLPEMRFALLPDRLVDPGLVEWAKHRHVVHDLALGLARITRRGPITSDAQRIVTTLHTLMGVVFLTDPRPLPDPYAPSTEVDDALDRLRAKYPDRDAAS